MGRMTTLSLPTLQPLACSAVPWKTPALSNRHLQQLHCNSYQRHVRHPEQGAGLYVPDEDISYMQSLAVH